MVSAALATMTTPGLVMMLDALAWAVRKLSMLTVERGLTTAPGSANDVPHR
jgi:hypothetical protein